MSEEDIFQPHRIEMCRQFVKILKSTTIEEARKQFIAFWHELIEIPTDWK